MSTNEGDDTRAVREIADDIFGANVWGESGANAHAASSVDVMRFLVRIERRFGITVPDEELLGENFVSTESVLALVRRYRS